MVKRFLYLILILFAFQLISCSKYQKLLKSNDNNEKFERAITYYDHGDYYRAQQLFDQLINVYAGTDKVEKINYYYAYSYFKQDDYITASYYFKQFAKKFPNSKLAEECAYMSAYCQYMDSPKYNLDQTNTTESIKEFQLFINAYPQSERIPKCNELMDKLRGKLELKSFETAKLYFKMEDYKAAITTFNNVLRDFPDTPHREEIMFDIIKANYKYALKSIESKKKERYQAAIEAFDSFISAYPESSYLNQANIMQKNSLKFIKNYF